MTFANPIGLLGLLAVPVILILHLLRERRHRQVVSNINLWSFLEEEVRGPRPQRIPFTWILLLDLLIGALLGLAWAQPQIVLALPIKDARHVVILMDVSSSMQAGDVLPSRIGQAVLDVSSLVNGLGSQDTATIITFGKDVSWVADTREMELQAMLSRLASLEAVETGHEIDAAFVLGLSAQNGNIPLEFHVFTDAAFELDQPEAVKMWDEFGHPIVWHFYGEEISNQAVLDVEVLVIDETEVQVFTRAANFGKRAANRLLVLLADGEPVDSVPVEMPPDSTMTHLWMINKPATAFTVSLAGGDQYPVDDTFTTGVAPYDKVEVVYVTETLAPIDLALEALPDTELTIFSPEDYSPHYQADLTIFRNALPASWPEGVVLIVEPPAEQAGTQAIFPPRLETPRDIPLGESLLIPGADPLLDGIDFGSIRWIQVWALSEAAQGFMPIVQAGETPVILRGRQGSTDIYVLLAHLERGNFTKDAAFIIMMANLVGSTRRLVVPENLLLDRQIPLPALEDYQLLRVTAPGAESVEYRQNWPAAWEDTSIPGTYLIELQDANGELSAHAVGVNAADEEESDLSPKEWSRSVAGSTSSATSSGSVVEERQVNLMPYLLGLVIFLLVIEAALAWR